MSGAAETVILCMRVADMPVPAFPGDLLKTCSACHLPVRVRPYMPAGRLVCSRCFGLEPGR